MPLLFCNRSCLCGTCRVCRHVPQLLFSCLADFLQQFLDLLWVVGSGASQRVTKDSGIFRPSHDISWLSEIQSHHSNLSSIMLSHAQICQMRSHLSNAKSSYSAQLSSSASRILLWTCRWEHSHIRLVKKCTNLPCLNMPHMASRNLPPPLLILVLVVFACPREHDVGHDSWLI